MPDAGTQDEAWTAGAETGPGEAGPKLQGLEVGVRWGGPGLIKRGCSASGPSEPILGAQLRPLPLVARLRVPADACSECQAGTVGWGCGQRRCVGCWQRAPPVWPRLPEQRSDSPVPRLFRSCRWDPACAEAKDGGPGPGTGLLEGRRMSGGTGSVRGGDHQSGGGQWDCSSGQWEAEGGASRATRMEMALPRADFLSPAPELLLGRGREETG